MVAGGTCVELATEAPAPSTHQQMNEASMTMSMTGYSAYTSDEWFTGL